MAKRPVARTIVHAIGLIVLAASLYFIIRQTIDLHDKLAASFSDSVFVAAIVALAAVYAANLGWMALAWGTLAGIRPEGAARRALLTLYGSANLGKYLPGNVMHYAIRQLLAQKVGLSQSAAVTATVSEQLLHLPVVGLVAGLGALIALAAGGAAFGPIPPLVLVGLPLAGTAALIAFPLLSRKLALRFTLFQSFGQVRVRDILRAGRLQGQFFIASAVSVGLLHLLLAGSFSLANLALTACLYLWCWLAGFIVPGAPGGLGVREALMLTALAPVMGAEQALVISFASRAVTVLGDLLFFARVHIANRLAAP